MSIYKADSWRPALESGDTRLQAHRAIAPHRADLKERVYLAIEAGNGPHTVGVTCDFVEVRTGLSHQTASARIRELATEGRILDSNVRARTRSGRLAICWKVK